MDPLETVFLDAGGVLVGPNWQRVSGALMRQGIAVQPAVLHAAEPYGTFAIDTEQTVAATSDEDRWAAYFNAVLERVGVAPGPAMAAALQDVRAYHALHNLWEIVSPDAIDVLERLRRMGLRLVVVSNANGRLRESFDRLGLTALVDVIVDSHEEGVEKPDPALFQIALARAGARADTTVHVGDIYHVDVVGARAAGIEGVLLDRADLYSGVRCERVRTLQGLVDALTDGCWLAGPPR